MVSRCLPHIGHGLRIGITGPPGVGKSSFIDALGTLAANQDKRVAVLAIDPSSKMSKGSILGDKTRMPRLAVHPNAFIRPSPNSGMTGGLATKTREALILCEAAGYDLLFIETVGVGQSEFEVHSMVDMLLLLLITGAGDEIQGIKRGIMEMADLLIINKADGENAREAKLLQRSLMHILRLIPRSRPGWETKAISISSLEGIGVDEVWRTIQQYAASMRGNGLLKETRKHQAIAWLHQHIEYSLQSAFYNNDSVQKNVGLMESAIAAGDVSPIDAAEELLKLFLE